MEIYWRRQTGNHNAGHSPCAHWPGPLYPSNCFLGHNSSWMDAVKPQPGRLESRVMRAGRGRALGSNQELARTLGREGAWALGEQEGPLLGMYHARIQTVRQGTKPPSFLLTLLPGTSRVGGVAVRWRHTQGWLRERRREGSLVKGWHGRGQHSSLPIRRRHPLDQPAQARGFQENQEGHAAL